MVKGGDFIVLAAIAAFICSVWTTAIVCQGIRVLADLLWDGSGDW